MARRMMIIMNILKLDLFPLNSKEVQREKKNKLLFKRHALLLPVLYIFCLWTILDSTGSVHTVAYM